MRGAGFLLLLIGTPHGLSAQTDPRGPIRTIDTPHFAVHFKTADSALARRAAAYAETAYGHLSAELAAPRGRIDLALVDNTDASNGYAQVFPTNRVVIYAVPPVGIQELRFQDNWLELVITHELAHIFHIDRARGIWSLGRNIFGRNPLLFPNQLTPSWVKEGLAVYYESKLTGSGRNVSTEAPMVMRAAAIAREIPGISRWSLATSRFPGGQIAYAYGAQLMLRAASAAADTNAARGGSSSFGMRKFVDNTAAYPIPFLLNSRAKAGFGTSFGKLFDKLRDSLYNHTQSSGTTGDRQWMTVSTNGWYAVAPRWKGNDTLVWAASNGREVAGLYEAAVPRGAPVRISRRNGLDVNIPLGGDSTLFGQVDYLDPYTIRYDLYEGEGRAQRRITRGGRLTQPDVRKDGAIVAVQLQAAGSRLVRVTRTGTITPITDREMWAEPRWSPDGRYIAAAQLLANGEQRVVVLDTLGALVRVMAGKRAVFASPSFSPDMRTMIWTSDRSGSMQIESGQLTAAETDAASAGAVSRDTLTYRSDTTRVSTITNVSTGVFQPSISPDGLHIAALVYRVDGFHVSVGNLSQERSAPRDGWYAQANESPRAATRDDSTVGRNITGRAHGYSVARQLLPSYWFPEIGTGRDSKSTYGLSSSATDILSRHSWSATALINPRSNETDAFGFYRYRGIGTINLDFAASQEWDATFRITDTANTTLGLLARRRRFVSAATGWSRPRVRFSTSGSLGAQYEWRDFATETDSILGDAGSLLRTGTRYPSLYATAGLSTLRRAGRSIAFEEGVTLSGSTTYRWRQDAPELGSWRSLATGRGYIPLDFPGFARHVLSARVTGGVADEKTATEFSIGGVSGQAADIIPGVRLGDPSRSFPVRGVEPDAQRGIRALGATVEYRVPLLMLRDVPSPFTVYADRISMTLFSDAGRATCPASLARTGTPVCERIGTRDGWIASAGAELALDLAVQYDVPYRVRFGAAVPYAAPPEISRKGRVYVTLGSYF